MNSRGRRWRREEGEEEVNEEGRKERNKMMRRKWEVGRRRGS